MSERYAIPPSPPVTITYTGLPLDEIEDALECSVAMQNACGILVRKQQKITGRRVTPLQKGHVGFLACSGMLNGFLGEGKTRHIAHCRSVKMWTSSTGRAKAKERPSFRSENGSAMN